MRRLALLLGVLISGALLVTSCSKDKKLERKIRGSWSVTGKDVNNSQKGGLDASMTISGTCEFRKKTGQCDYKVNINYTFIDSIDTISASMTQNVSYEITEWYVEGDYIYFTYSDGTIQVFYIQQFDGDYMYLVPAEGKESASMEISMVTPDGYVNFSFKYELEMRRQ